MILGALIGAMLACSLVGLVYALYPAPEPLAAVIARLESDARDWTTIHTFRDRLGAQVLSLVPRDLVARLGPDLEVTDTSGPALAADAALSGLGAALATVGVFAAMTFAHIQVSYVVPLGMILAVAGLGAAAPVLALRREAARAREHVREALAVACDLVLTGMAAGMGLEEALEAATGASTDRAFVAMRHALDVASHSGVTPWSALGDLGQSLGVAELSELASTLSLAGTEGAKVRESLAAKADSLRRHAEAKAEAEANALTERLFFPGVFLLAGFLIFIGFPAVMRIFEGF